MKFNTNNMLNVFIKIIRKYSSLKDESGFHLFNENRSLHDRLDSNAFSYSVSSSYPVSSYIGLFLNGKENRKYIIKNIKNYEI